MDQPPLPPGLVRKPWWWRTLVRMGVASVWGAGLAVLVIALAVLGAIGLSRLPAGHRLTFGMANRSLAAASNLRLSAQRSLLIEHGAWLVSPLIEIVDSTGTRRPFIQAARARLVTSWWGLLSRKPEAVRVELEDAVITLTRSRSGGWIVPEFHPAHQGGPGSPLAIDLGFKNTLVRVVGAGMPADTVLRSVDLTGRAHGVGATWDFALGRLTAVLPHAGLAIQKGEGQARLSEGRLALDRLRLRTDAGWLELEASGPLTPKIDLEGRLRAGEWTWHDLAQMTHQPALDIAGGIAGEGRIHLTADAFALEDVDSDVLWRDEPAAARFDGRWSRGRLTVTDARVAWRKATYAGNFTLEPAARHWRLDGALEGLQLAELPRLWPMPPLEPGLVSGQVDLESDPRGLSGRVARGRGTWREVPFDSLAGTWALVDGVQAIDARVRASGAGVVAQGTIGRGALDGRVHVAGLDAARVRAAWWRDLGLTTPPGGRLESLEAQFTGSSSRPNVRGSATVSNLRVGTLDVTRGVLAFDGALGSNYALKLESRTGDARAGFASADSTEAQAMVSPRRIEVGRFWAERAESTLTFSGNALRDGNDWTIRVDRLAWDGGERIQLNNDGPIDLRLEPGGVVTIGRARVVSTAGALSAHGRWGGDHGSSDLALDLETLDLEALLGPIAARYQVRGVLTGHARLEGPPGRAAWTVDLDGSELHYRTYAARRLVARGRFDNEFWRVERLALDTGRGRLNFTGELAWAEPPPWSGTPADWNRALTRSPRWSGTLTTDSLSLAQISEFYPQAGGWRGELSIVAELSGRPAAPVTTVRGRLGRPGWGQGSLNDFDLDLDFRNELLTIRRFAMVGPDSLGPTLTGTLPMRMGWGVKASDRLPDRPMSLVAHARGLDLGLVPLVLPQIAAASGLADIDARITGTPRSPYATGSITVRDGIVRPANREEVLTGVAGTIHLDGSELKIANFEARQGKRGRIVISPGGVAHLKNLRIADYHFALDAQRATAFASGNYVIEFDGKFDVRNGADTGGPIPLPHITGTASVIEGVFLANLADPDRQAAWQGPAVLPPWTYDIAVEARNNVWWRPAEANIEAKLTDFEVIQDLDRFLLLGDVDALRGRYYFLGNQFDVKTGQLFFDLTAPMNPRVNAVLTTDVPLSKTGAPETITRETITLTVTGRAQQPTVNLESKSGLSQTEIATLLTRGELRTGGEASAIGQIGAEYLIRQLMRQFPELEYNFAYIELGRTSDQNATTTGTTRAYTTLGVSRYFTRDLLVRYSQVVGDIAAAHSVDYQDFEAEYRLNRLLFLSGQVTRRRGVLVTSQDQTQYNLDIRARYEY